MTESRYIIRRHLRPWGWRYTWQLQAGGNHERLCSTEPYTTRQAAYDGIDAHRRAAATTIVVDMSA